MAQVYAMDALPFSTQKLVQSLFSINEKEKRKKERKKPPDEKTQSKQPPNVSKVPKPVAGKVVLFFSFPP